MLFHLAYSLVTVVSQTGRHTKTLFNAVFDVEWSKTIL